MNSNWKVPPEKRIERAKKAQKAKMENWRKKFEENVQTKSFDDLTLKERRERILREQEGRCSMCNSPQMWNNLPLKFELDHISGDRSDESRNNLRLVCPNCHSQTETYKTTKTNRKRYTDEEIIAALKNSDSAYKAMKSLGMNPHGGNYVRLRHIVKKYNLILSYSF